MVRTVDLDALDRLLADDEAQLVEVLPAEEFLWGHLPGAVNLPLKQLDEHAASHLDRGRPVVVYCNDFP